MIKLIRPNEPQILQDNKSNWQQALMDAVLKYGAYTKIPENEKKSLVFHYRDKDIKEPLCSSSNNKCAFCESMPLETGNIEIEHFKPKSKYPESTFDWSNLLPSCHKCNNNKSTHDTVIEPIINPYEKDPSNYFYFEDIRLKEKERHDKIIAENTKKVCGLNDIRLLKPRSEILISLIGYEKDIEDALKDYEGSDTDRRKSSKLRALRESLAEIEYLCDAKKQHSAFVSNFLNNSKIYMSAKKLLEETQQVS